MTRSDWTFLGILALVLLMVTAVAYGYLRVMGVLR